MGCRLERGRARCHPRPPSTPEALAMGDSDDEYDRRRRDKFRRERSDYDRSRERDDRRRDDWNDRDWDRGRERRSRGEYRDYDRNRRERFSPPRHELSPPQKRMRRDWDEHSGDPYHSGYEMPYSGGGAGPAYGPPQPWAHPDMHVMQHHILPIQARLGNIAEVDLGMAPPVMKSFKEFLLSLDDSVDETEAVKRYNDYKLDFRRQQMQDFFLAHKDEEWFRSKYHPDEAGRRKQDAQGALQNRLRVFLYLLDNAWFDTLLLDMDKASAIIKTLDAAVIKMEGGTENDLKILDQEEEEEGRTEKGEAAKKEEPRPPEPERKGPEHEAKKDEAKKDSGNGQGVGRSVVAGKRFFRRGWVTFDRSVNIKEICWSLQNIRLRECELSPGVNRDLTRRVRNVNGITQHKAIVRNDIKLAAKLIHVLDDRTQLWGASPPRDSPSGAALPAQNPILKNITDYLIEEVSAEEEELLGQGHAPDDPPKEGNPAEVTVERDEKLLKVLDRLLLYLRIVHSVDYYNTAEYVNEDEMPNRCGIVHVRGPLPPNRVTHGEVAEWQKTFEEKLAPLLSVRETLAEEEAQKMGRKDPEQEVEKFVTANTQELGKDKWLCPLSGKKFKGPEFVRKHIFNKHAEKIEEVKKEVAFFNNFLLDAKRPALPELKPNQPPGPGQGLAPGLPYPPQTPQGMMPYGQPRPPILGYGGGPPYPPGPYAAGRGNYDTFRGQGGYLNKPRNRLVRGDPRAIIEYRDLDAPEDVDFF
ncbi:serrate RNA effector molecule-like protein [Alligator mississippiensis]|uniref:Serrate RNA effector molecule-like protein n=1 Tax=Alligator mississippiensis TaxID=8496 RepID=A0A151MMU1_ALLMI|nr:serrate RNA effector molecule-like protein [Alligator mississippiensis]